MVEFTKENLEKLIRESKSKGEVLIKAGRSKRAWTFLNRKIEEYQINISHFSSTYELQSSNIKGKNLSELNKVLDYNSNHGLSGENVKSRLFKLGLKKKECELCGLGEYWNGKKLVHHLDHINGIRKDWRLENLRVLCPNCHTQTETYAGRNRGDLVSKHLKPILESGVDLYQPGYLGRLVEKLGKTEIFWYGTLRGLKILGYFADIPHNSTSEKRKEKLREYHKNKVVDNTELKNKILESGVDFTKWGWAKELSKILNCTPQWALKQTKQVLPEFYQEKCRK